MLLYLLITNPPPIVNISNKAMLKAMELKNRKIEYSVIYDGSWYPKTYQYYKDKNTFYTIEKDTIFPDVLGKDFVSFEKHFKTTETGYREWENIDD